MPFEFLNLRTEFHSPASFLISRASHGWMTILRPWRISWTGWGRSALFLLLHPKGRGRERDGWNVSGATQKWKVELPTQPLCQQGFNLWGWSILLFFFGVHLFWVLLFVAWDYWWLSWEGKVFPLVIKCTQRIPYDSHILLFDLLK